jgi:vitamin B12 transporter
MILTEHFNFNNPDTPLNVSTSEQFRLGFSKYKYEKESLC